MTFLLHDLLHEWYLKTEADYIYNRNIGCDVAQASTALFAQISQTCWYNGVSDIV
jgi:hypothetical protein